MVGSLGDSVVEHLPSGHGVIPESQDQSPASGALWGGLLLPLPMSLPLSVRLS